MTRARRADRGRDLILLGMLSLSGGATMSARESPKSSIADIAWLAGCWERTAGETRIEEQWMRPGGGTMLGMSRTVSGDTTRTYEYMQIREEGGRLVFTARPAGQTQAWFASIRVTPSQVVFENPTHDFPQRVIYARGAGDSLYARIEGERGGKLRGVDFPMRRTRCAGGDGR